MVGEVVIKQKAAFLETRMKILWGTLNNFGIFQRFIIAIAIVSMVLIWPAGLFKVGHVSVGNMEGTRVSTPLTETEVVRQEFSPNYEMVKSIDIYATNNPDSFDTMQVVFRLYNRTGGCLLEYKFALEDYAFPGFISIPINMKLIPGEVYFYTIGGMDGEFFSLFCNEDGKTPENAGMYYKEVVAGGTSLLTQYEYTRPMGLKRILVLDCLIGMLSFGLIFLVQVVRSKLTQERWKGVEKNFKKVLCVLVGLFACVTLYAIVIQKLFAQDALNITVLAIGILLLALYAGFCIWKCPSDYDHLKNSDKELKTVLISFVRSLLWAAAIIFCCLHTNAMTDYEKGLHMRCLLTCMGILFVSYGKKREIFNIPNLVWTIVMIPIGKYYISLHSAHIEYINTATRAAFVIWAIGLVLINLCYILRKETLQKCKNISIPYTLAVACFMGLCIAFRQGRQWTIVLMVVAFLMAFKFILYGNRELILEEICNGILLAFAGTTCFCICRRAYQYYLLHRYSGVFATSTTNTLYLCIPLAAALTKISKNRSVKNNLTWYAVTGSVIAYLLFTASRTGFMVMAVSMLFYLAFPYSNREKNWLLKNIRAGLCGFLILLAGFISTFTITRMLPAVVGNPFYFFYEKDASFMKEDTPWSGYETGARYMTIERMLEVIFERTFSTQEALLPEKENDWREEALVASNAVSASMMSDPSNVDESKKDFTNGRTDIYREYLQRMNLTGHPDMGIELESGEYLLHAHNSFIQVMYDFGIPVGIVFLIVCLWAFLRSCKMAYRNGASDERYLLPMYLIATFGVASITEWVYYLTIPLGLSFILMLMVLCDKRK